MNKRLITLSVIVVSTFAMADFVAVVSFDDNNLSFEDGSSGGGEPTIPDTAIRCASGEGVTRGELITMIDSGADVTEVCTSNITDFSELFYRLRYGANQSVTTTFNQDISKWDVSNGVDFHYMFNYAVAFNQDISNWDVSKATNFNYMLARADKFNQDIGKWDVSKVTNFSYMFFNADVFNQDIHLWDVENATKWGDFKSYTILSSSNTPCKLGGNCTLDTDGDGVLDHNEVYNDTDPLDPNSK